MAFQFRTVLPPGGAYVGYIRKLGTDWSAGVLWNNNTLAWDTSNAVPLAGNYHEIPVTQVSASSQDKSLYTLDVSVDLATYTGWAEVAFIDQQVGVDYVTSTERVYISNGLLAREPYSLRTAEVVDGLLENTERTVRVFCSKYRDQTAPATGSVTSTVVGFPGGSTTATTNAASYTGVPGIYKVTLTAAETNVSASLRDDLVVTITTSDGTGTLYMEFNPAEIESDWADGGRLDTILDTIEGYTDQIRADIAFAETTYWQTVPSAATIADSVWDEDISTHVTAGSAGERVERLDILASGGAGELTTVRMNKLDFLDQAVSGNASFADVSSAVELQIQNHHLDHLFSNPYDAATPVGDAASFLRQLTENDGSVPRFTANALEQAPSVTASVDVAAIADAVWDEATSGHTTLGTTGAELVKLTTVLADTNELQTDWADGGRLDLILDTSATVASAAAIRAEIDSNSTQLAAIVADTNELQTLWTTGGARTVTLAAAATQASVDALNDVSLASITSELNTLYTGTLDARFDALDTAVAGVLSTGNSAWITSTLTASAIAEAVWDEAAAGHTTAGTFGNYAGNLPDIVADTNELQTNWASPAGSLYDLLNTRADDTIEAKITDIDVTLEPGGVIHTLINNITPFDNTLSAEIVADARRWVAPAEGAVASNTVYMSEGDEAHVAMRFAGILNPDTSIASVGGVTVVAGDAVDLTFDTADVAQNFQEVHVKVSGQLSGKQYKLKFVVTTTDNETISAIGILQVN
jgi:hypothetical protein